jgi:ABC-type antimicrobial peptide transport system permease subunit
MVAPVRASDIAREIQDSLKLSGLRLVLASCGIAIGVASIIALLAIDGGFYDFLETTALSSEAYNPVPLAAGAAPSLPSLTELAWLSNNLGNCRLALVAIALISLLIGAVGLLGMMLSIVIERREEMEMRRAMGACSSDIARIFLLTSITICLVAGVVGVALGSLAAFGIMDIMLAAQSFENLYPIINGGFLATIIIICIAMGFAIGLYPAYRAANTKGL